MARVERSPSGRPATRLRCPSAIPTGIGTATVRVCASRPAPAQTAHGCSGILPSPPQTSQTAVRTSWPNRVRETACSWPEPRQRVLERLPYDLYAVEGLD